MKELEDSKLKFENDKAEAESALLKAQTKLEKEVEIRLYFE